MTAVIAAAAAPVPAATPQQLFANRCAMCHQTSGAGLPGQFPRLAGRTNVIAQSPSGRRYLVLVLLNGMAGRIEVDGKPISGVMPGVGMLKDQELADILNHTIRLLRSGGKMPASFTAAEVAAVRSGGKMALSAVAAERARLVASGVIR